MVKSSIIILNYNSKPFIDGCLDSIISSSKMFNDFELILVDNGSIDGSVNYVRNKYPTVKLIENKNNFGFAKGNNIGIKLSKGDYIVLLNPDTSVTPDWLYELIKTAESDSKIGIVGSKNLLFDRKTIDTTGHIYYKELCSFRNRGAGEKDKGQYDHLTDVLSVQFSSVLIKREVLKDVGLLDEDMFLFNEDTDYCLRARIYGWQIRYCPKSIVYHYGGASWKKENNWKIHKYGLAYRTHTLLKSYESINALKYGLLSLSFCWVAIIWSIFNYRKFWAYGNMRSFLYAFFWNLLHIPFLERSNIQRRRRVKDKDIFKYSTPFRFFRKR